MRVLMVDDDEGYAPTIARWLRETHHFEVTLAGDPYGARRALLSDEFHVVVVDIRFSPLADAFLDRLQRGKVNLRTDTEFLVSGLTTLHDVATIGRRPGSGNVSKPATVVWTSGEGARGLQLPFARQQLGARVFCSHLSPRERLLQAIRRADARQPYADASLSVHLPKDHAAPIRSLFDKAPWRSIWPALAVGAYNAGMVSSLTGLSQYSVRDHVGGMRTMLLTDIDVGASRPEDARAAMPVVYGYARDNREFFLDDLILRLYTANCMTGLARSGA